MGTNRKVLDELLSQTRTVGMPGGSEIVLTTPTQSALAGVRNASAELDLTDANATYAGLCHVATLAVAATLILDGEAHPSGDEVVAGRLVRLAVDGEEDVLFASDLTRTALELCGVLEPGRKGEGGESPPA